MNKRSDNSRAPQTVRCAVYTRKSHEEGLSQEFNSLDAQREAGEAYVASHRGQGWVLLPERYDDAAFSGATTDRPALQRLLRDVDQDRVDAILVYKLDRLSRSLLDFLRIVEVLDAHDVALVSVTQAFDTKTSMGRLTLNILLSFAQFEREITAERIRDKVAAAKRRGQHTGGPPVLGYDIDHVAKRLTVNEDEARLVRRIFKRFVELGTASKVAEELNDLGEQTKRHTTRQGVERGGHAWNKAAIYKVLRNVKYLGKVEHRGQSYAGEHEAIVSQKLWDEVQHVLCQNGRSRGNRTRSRTPALLAGLIHCGHCDRPMGATYSTRRGRTYRYYLCRSAASNGYETCPIRTVPAGEIEAAVVDQLRAVFASPEVVARTFREARCREQEEAERLREQRKDLKKRVAGNGTPELRDRLARVEADLRALSDRNLTETEVAEALRTFDGIWDELFPAEQQRIVRLLVERADVHPDGLELRIRCDGLRSLVAEVGAGEGEQ